MAANISLTDEIIKDSLDQMRGAVMIVYPMGLPPHDPIRHELENKEDLSGTQVKLPVLKTQVMYAKVYKCTTCKLMD